MKNLEDKANAIIAGEQPAIPEGPDSPALYSASQLRRIIIRLIGEDIDREAETVAALAQKAEEVAEAIRRQEALLRDFFTPKAAANV